MANQPDSAIIDKQQRTVTVIDAAIPNDGNIRKKTHENLEKPRPQGRNRKSLEGEDNGSAHGYWNTGGSNQLRYCKYP